VELNWTNSPANVMLSANVAHVWRLDLAQPHDESGFYACLSDDEKSRADGFKFSNLRSRFIAAHGGLRQILAGYLKRDASEVALVLDENDKPQIAPDQNPQGLAFNLSHSGDLALVSIAKAAGVGIDVEMIREINDTQLLAKRFFSARESLALALLDVEHQLVGFFRVWTAKEAYLKAIGVGVTGNLKGFTVSPHAHSRQIGIEFDQRSEDGSWVLQGLPMSSSYIAAIALPLAHDWKLELFDFEPGLIFQCRID
jgi:4'-phosphopantetheinyl transferase